MQLNNNTIHNNTNNTFSYIKSSSILSVSEDSNDLFFTGYNSMLTNQHNKIAKDFCLLLVVYIHCFCLPIFSFVTKILRGFGESIGNERSEMACFEGIENVSFKEGKNFFFKLLFSFRYQVEYNILIGNLSYKAVKS
jgi:hypothetical protein